MSRRWPVLAFVLFWVSLPLLPRQDEDLLIDDIGTRHLVGAPPARIVSLAPNITEILFALGLGKRVVGLTRYCNHPPEAQSKPKIGGLVDPIPERIIALNPDLVIGFRGNPLAQLQRMIRLGLPVFVLEMGTTFDSVYHLIDRIGRITRREDEADRLAAGIRQRQESILGKLRGVEHRPRVFFMLYGMGFWTGGKDSFLHDIVTRAGGINIAGDIPLSWLHYSREKLVHEDPEVILIIAKSPDLFAQGETWLRETLASHDLSALKTGRIYYLNEDLATRPGPRIIDALARVAEILHPRLFIEGKD